MQRFLTMFLFLSSLPSLAALQGYVCVIELSEFRCWVSGYGERGQPLYSGQLTGAKARQERYVSRTSAPSLADLGLTMYCDFAGNAVPRPYSYPFVLWEVTGMQSYAVYDDTEGADLTPLGNLLEDKILTPVYQASPSSPSSFLLNGNNRYMGRNPNFGADGSLTIVQGQVGPSNPSIPNYYYYDPNNRSVIITSNPTSNMGTYVWDSSVAGYVYTPAISSSSGDVNLSPVVSAIETQGGLTRSQLVDLLGSSGNSWVYDCKLSVQQLRDLADQYYPDILSAIGQGSTDVSTSLNGGFESVVGALENIEVSPTVNVAAPNVTVQPAQVNIDTSSLLQDSTYRSYGDRYAFFLNNFDSYIADITSSVWSMMDDVYQNRLNTDQIKNKLNEWDTGNNITYSPADFGDSTPDEELPQAWQSSAADFPSSVSQTLGTLTDWGDNGVPTAFSFNPISGLLNSFVGSIPSVGSDRSLFSFEFDFPYIGRIQRYYSWDDFPYIPEFRQFLLWCLYVFFGIAVFKLIHRSII